MSYRLLPAGDGFTALTDEDHDGLIPTHITTRGALNDAEQQGILAALDRRAPAIHKLLDDLYLRNLHKAMFGTVWTWAGHYRTRETNIGVDSIHIGPRVRALVGDTRAWIDNGAYPVDEIAARFHHALVATHPFRNGNGRHGRIATDYLLTALGEQPFRWGIGLSLAHHEVRGRYHSALESATGGDLRPLLAFVRQ